MDATEAVPKVGFMQAAYFEQVRAQRLDEGTGEHGDPILLALRVANKNLPILKVHILDSQSQAFQQAKPTAIYERCHQP